MDEEQYQIYLWAPYICGLLIGLTCFYLGRLYGRFGKR